MYCNRRRLSSLTYILVNLYQQFDLLLCPAFPLVFFKLLNLLSFSSVLFFSAVLDLRCCMGFSLVLVNGGQSPAVLQEVLTMVASVVMEPWLQVGWASVVANPGLQSTGSVVMAHRLSCSMACGVFPHQGQNPCLLHWQADSLLLSHQGNPVGCLYIQFTVPFAVQKLLSLSNSHLLLFVFISIILGRWIRKDITEIYVRVFCLCFSLGFYSVHYHTTFQILCSFIHQLIVLCNFQLFLVFTLSINIYLFNVCLDLFSFKIFLSL